MKYLILLLLSIICLQVSGQDSIKLKTYYSGKYYKVADVTKEFKRLNDSINTIKSKKDEPCIQIPILKLDGDKYVLTGRFDRMQLDTTRFYVILINPDNKDVTFSYNATCINKTNIRPEKIKLTMFREGNDLSNPWQSVDKKIADMSLQGDILNFIFPKKSCSIIDIKKKR